MNYLIVTADCEIADREIANPGMPKFIVCMMLFTFLLTTPLDFSRTIMEPLTVFGNLNALGTIAQYVIHAATVARLDKRATYHLRQAVDEIATNIIDHSYETGGLPGDLSISASIDDKTLTIILEDAGAAYDPTQQESPEDLNSPLEERKIGGLGVYLAMQGVDKFLYKRVGNCNHSIFIVNRPATVLA